MDAKQLADSCLRILQANPEYYKRFGVYWYLIKHLLKQFYTKDNLYLLGDYVDPTVTDRIPIGMPLDQALIEAVEEYQRNMSFGHGQNPVDPDGDEFILLDADAGM